MKNLSRRTKAILFLTLIGSILSILVALQQIALLYILATFGLIVLLVIVAFADLEKVGIEM